MSSSSAPQPTNSNKTSQYEYETLRLSVVKRDDKYLYCNYFVPSPSVFSKITFRGSEIFTDIQIAKLNGTQFGEFKQGSSLNTGMYTIRCSVQEEIKMPMKDIYYLEIKVHVVPLSNYQLANMLLTFQDRLGMNPAQDLGFSVKPETPPQPFHEKLEKTFDMTEISTQIEQAVLESKRSSKSLEGLMSIGEIVSENSQKYGDTIVKNTNGLIEKMKAMETLLEHLKENIEKKPTTSKNTIPDFSGIENKLSEIQILLGNPVKGENTKPLRDEIAKLKKERDMYHEQLQKAEDYIDSLDDK